MKIAYLGQKGIPMKYGGVEKHVELLAAAMVKNGHEVYVYARPYYTPKYLKVFKGVNIISLPSLKTKHLDAISHTLMATVHALFKDYDIIHYQGIGPALLAFIPRIFKPGAKVVVTFHCMDRMHAKWGWLARKVLKLAEKAACYFPHQTIAVSKVLQDYCWQYFKQPTVYLPNSVKQPAVEPPKRSESYLKKYSLKPQKYFLVVSRLIPHKNIEEAILAFQNLALKDYKLAIVGDGFFTDDYVAALKKLAGETPEIVFTGSLHGPALEAIFRQARAFLMPSKNEGLSFALLEALSFGLPVIGRRNPENLEFIGAKVMAGYGRIQELQAHLKKITEADAEYLLFGQRAQKYLDKNFNLQLVVNQTEMLYYQLLGRPLEEVSECKIL
ncbi:glycosyltransferase family 4 protein [Patescibacteria group bacterium]|nr:glycosyltransferase family 4 protein [Patescibacteria group bacterium]